MKTLLVTVQVLLLCYEIKAFFWTNNDETTDNNTNTDVDVQCTEVQEQFLGNLIYSFSKSESLDEADFYLGVKDEKEGIQISPQNLSAIETDNFDPSVRTYIITHGYRSHCQVDWMLRLKDKILENKQVNVILVDWSRGSYNWNYIGAVRDTTTVAKHISELFEAMYNKLGSESNATNILWNNLYFIGHSLGAQISGQAARLLQSNQFFTVERITGLDPAQPCFQKENLDIKLDKTDAKFVDIIHTQAGGFGVKEAIGHADYYVNGGAIQPSCTKSIFPTIILKRVCSHTACSSYFIESIVSSSNTACKFWGYKWNGTYDNAQEIVDEVKKGKPCPDCPEMGIDAVNNRQNGIFLVLTTTNEPQCQWTASDLRHVNRALKAA